MCDKIMEFEPTREDLQQLREWLKKTPHLVQDYDDQFLSAFVRASKGSLQKAKGFLESCNALGTRYPDFFGTYDPLYPRLQETLSTWILFPLPKKTPDGCTVIFNCINPKTADPSKSHVQDCYKYLLLTLYILIWENEFGSGQWTHVGDYRGAGLAYFKDLTPMFVKTIINFAESGIPVRVHSSASYNLPSVLEHIFNLFKLVGKKKLGERIMMYSTIDKLADQIPRKMLPKEYGGCEESIFVLHDNWKKKVESYRDRFLEEERKMRELDPLRPKTADDDEMMGTFRNLTVD